MDTKPFLLENAADALYLDSKLLNLLDKEKKYWIAVLKNENREAYKEVDGK